MKLLLFSMITVLFSSGYAAPLYTYNSTSGVCFNQNLERGFNTDETTSECRDFSSLSFVSRSFENQSLQGTSFKAANLLKASFSGADLRGVDFTDAYLKDVSFKNAIVDKFTKTSEYFDWEKAGAKLSVSNDDYDAKKEFEILVRKFTAHTSTIADIETFLTKNPTLDLNEITDDSPSSYSLHVLVINLLTQGQLDFFNCLVKRGFRFDLDFLRFTEDGYRREPNYLRAALASNREDVLDYVLRYYSPYKFTRVHLSTIINDLSPTSLDQIVKFHPNLLTDIPTKNYRNDDPLYNASKPDILNRLLELQIPQGATGDYSRKFLFEFKRTLDFRFLDIPLSFGFDFSNERTSLMEIVSKHWEHILDKSAFLKELKSRAYSPHQPHGLKVLAENELGRISSRIGNTFAFRGSGTDDIKNTAKYLDILRVYISLVGVPVNSNLLEEFLSQGGGGNYYWYLPEYEIAFRTILDLDPRPDLQYALEVVQSIQKNAKTPNDPICKRLLELIQSRMQKPTRDTL
ncbi:pentapeptide repeat-containing protein [Bdellovibrio sp. HCB2-146]|uniref:pentapeptide repeat-containing protein n=1 Tax=Bdellovibrio sp. HCB2-146 TaxID=3394362 RepID=UPI0039BD201D